MEGYKNILVPMDGSECSERALKQALLLKQAFGSKLTLLNIVSDPDIDCSMGNPSIVNASVKKEREDAEAYMAKRVADLPADVETKVVVGCISKSIIAEAEDMKADLIVMGSQGLGSVLRRLLVGSVAKNVLSNTEIPVLVVH